jgi:hypothetical protein
MRWRSTTATSRPSDGVAARASQGLAEPSWNDDLKIIYRRAGGCPQISRTGRSNRGIASGGIDQQLRAD